MNKFLGKSSKKPNRVILSLLDKNGRVPQKSGLNWGQREGREPNQAYIPVPSRIHQEHPGFFPKRGEKFTIKTDDGSEFTAVMAQDGDKAIESAYDNSELGKYFRRRIGVPDGEFITRSDLILYGRTDVEFMKLDNAVYFMDFS